LVPTVIGHSLLNYSLRHFRGQVVGLSNFSQPLFAGVLAFLVLSEVPDPIIYPAGVLIAIGVTIALLNPKPSPVQEPA
jgi:drug/metabolite transporter (DMT)-like permease